MKRERVLSGMRPTGSLHLGHLHGALSNWVKLQDEYECFFFVADWHVLTTDYEKVPDIKKTTRDMVIDWLAAGLDPERSTIFVQSEVKEHAELYLLLSMVTPLGWLERNPTYKEQKQELPDRDLSMHGFLGYPVLQAADILMYKASRVPVGVDQAPHLELTREIARRFNNFYGSVFPEPKTLLTETPKILGTDNRKMSKSYGNAICLSDPSETVEEKVMTMITDPQRKRRNDPGRPEVCNVYSYHQLYSPEALVREVHEQCVKAGIGCVEDKKQMAERLNATLEPIRRERARYEADPAGVDAILERGSARAREIAQKTMAEARAAVGL